MSRTEIEMWETNIENAASIVAAMLLYSAWKLKPT